MTNRSPLHDYHEANGARFVDFGGWDMPVQYEGVLAEHERVRTGVGVFDVSHLGRFELVGAAAMELLRAELCNDVSRIEPGRAQYTMALNENGGVVDDIIVLWMDEESFWVLPNGGNYDGILERFSGHGDATATSRREDTVMLAVQGPKALGVVDSVVDGHPGRFRVEVREFEGSEVIVSGTGYTGESGVELIAPSGAGQSLVEALVAAGAGLCGLGARDTLRLEMGYPLWGQDLDETTTPLEADLSWVVSWDHDFTGKSVLEAQRDGGVPRLLVGFTTEGRRFARHGYAARAGESSGEVTSGNFSPTLGHGIGMAYLSPPPADGATIEVEIRDTWYPAERVNPPFVKR